MKGKCTLHIIAVGALIVFIVLGLASGATASKATVKDVFPQEKEMYPAVYGAMAELYPNMPYLGIDFYNNVYKVGITGYALTTPLQYELNIKKNQAGELEYSYENLIQKDKDGRWVKLTAFGFYDYDGVTAKFSSKMIEIANDPAKYDNYQKAAMANITFVYSIMKNFTDLQFSDFINNYAKGSIFGIDGKLSDVKEFGKPINGTTYKYVVTLTQDLTTNESSFYFASRDYVYCRFYTNQDSVIRLSKTASLSVKGVLTSASKGSIGASLYLDLVDAN
ncbi:hypothetical protein R84B8_01326 [Treponema sp. R8-4-B8]